MRTALRRGELAGALVIAALVGASGHAHAQAAPAAPPVDSGRSAKVAAEALFEDGRRLVAEGKLAEACPKFVESQRLDPSPGTLLNLASCYEKSGRTATAWATYREGASAAQAAGRQDLVATAGRHADQLFPSLPRRSVNVPSPVDGLVVTIDGVEVGRAEWGAPVPADPGEHDVVASAPRFKTWTAKLAVPNDGAVHSVDVPALEPAPVHVAPPAAPAAVPPAPAPSPPVAPSSPSSADSGLGTQRWLAIAAGGVGVVGVALGAGFALSAKSQNSDSMGDCLAGSPNVCTAAGVSERNQAITSANVATGMFIVGGVALAAGVALWITAPPEHAPGAQSASIAIVPSVGGGELRATW